MNVLEQQLAHLVDECRPYTAQGKVADYIPELAHVQDDLLGVAICLPDGSYIHAGDVHHKFTIQSVSKALTLCYVLMEFGEDYVFSKVGMEPTGDAFNSIAKLEETVPSKPLNPMINAGALAVTSMILGDTAELK
ncbi:MAG: glutaminase, partial [Exiguobacterium chiriqhucha]